MSLQSRLTIEVMVLSAMFFACGGDLLHLHRCEVRNGLTRGSVEMGMRLRDRL